MSAIGSPVELNEDHTAERRVRAGSPFGFTTSILALLVVFALGYLYGGWKSRWEQQMIVEGAVAHFADTKLIRPGLENDLAAVNARLSAVSSELERLPEPAATLSKEELAEAEKRRKVIRENLQLCEAAIKRIEDVYGLSDAERSMLATIAALKQAELRRTVEALSNKRSNAKAVAEPSRKESSSMSASESATSESAKRTTPPAQK
jgi:hypothetical protein